MFPNRSNNQVLKVAGVTLLAGILIAGQAFTAYMAFNQKQQLNTWRDAATACRRSAASLVREYLFNWLLIILPFKSPLTHHHRCPLMKA